MPGYFDPTPHTTHIVPCSLVRMEPEHPILVYKVYKGNVLWACSGREGIVLTTFVAVDLLRGSFVWYRRKNSKWCVVC